MLEAAGSCLHHSRLPLYRDPPGALPSGEKLTLRIKIRWQGKNIHPLLAWEMNEGERLESMNYVGEEEDGYRLYEAQIQLPPEERGLLRYHFIINNGVGLGYYTGETGWGALNREDDGRRYQVTVYDPAYRTPEWPRKGVMYHIFVDRFARGSEGGGLARGDYHRKMGRSVYCHEDWYEQPLYLPHGGEEEYLPDDFFGGDLEGIRQKLPYLAELGATCLYLSPIFEADSNHKYNSADYHKIDCMFGTEEDFLRLCREAEGLGIRILLDGVFSHTGDDSVYFNRKGNYDSLGAYQSQDSPYYPWYRFNEYPDDYDCWWGFASLPNVKEMNESYWDFMLGEDGVAGQWLEKGASGWRLDVADELPEEFIRGLRRAVKAVDGEKLLLGEVWEDASNKEVDGQRREYVLGDQLDSVMNYPMRGAIFDFLLHKGGAFDAVEGLAFLQENYPPPFYYDCMNLLGSHDVPRALSLLGGGPDKDAPLSRAEQAAFALNKEERALGLKRLRLATLLQMGIPGCPCVYYGDEAGVEGLMDPLNRGTYPWGREDVDLLADVKEMIRLRRAHPVLQTGACSFLAAGEDVLGALRFVHDGRDALGEACENGTYILLVNRSEAPRELCLRLDADTVEGRDARRFVSSDGRYKDLLGGGAFSCEGGEMKLRLPPLGAMCLRRDEE